MTHVGAGSEEVLMLRRNVIFYSASDGGGFAKIDRGSLDTKGGQKSKTSGYK